MAISVANTLTPMLWKGGPEVVIRGKFVLGLAGTYGDSNVYLASNLHLVRLATAVSGATFSLQVLGRAADQYGMTQDGVVYNGIEDIAGFGTYKYRQLHNQEYGVISQYPRNDIPGRFYAPRIWSRPLPEPDYGYGSRGYAKSVEGEASAHDYTSNLGELVAPDVRIVLRGALAQLDVTGIRAIGFRGSSDAVGYDIASELWYSQYFYSGPGFSAGVGWRITDIHIRDNSQLYGHVNSGGAPVFWD